MKPLILCWYKSLLPAKLPQCPVSQFEIPATFLGGLSGIVEMVICYLPCQWGASPRPLEEVSSPGANGQFNPEEGLVLLASQGEDLRCTMEPYEAGISERRGAQLIRLVRTRFK
jgi:hypothetical protein